MVPSDHRRASRQAPRRGSGTRVPVGAALILSAFAALGCATVEAPRVDEPASAIVPDHHNARNALDWAGTYEGELPGVGFSRLLLEVDETYVLEQGEVVYGRFTWLPDGNTIELDEAAGG